MPQRSCSSRTASGTGSPIAGISPATVAAVDAFVVQHRDHGRRADGAGRAEHLDQPVRWRVRRRQRDPVGRR